MRTLFAAAVLALGSASANAGTPMNSVVFNAVPALDDLGLIALTVVVAVAGGLVARRRGRNHKK